MKFDKWLDTFVSEKGINLDEMFPIERDGKVYVRDYKFVIDALKERFTFEEKELIKKQIVGLDFVNADFKKYFQKVGSSLYVL